MLYGNIQRIDNALIKISDKVEETKEKLEDTKNQLENAKNEVEKVFPQEEELQKKIKRLNVLNRELKIDEKDNEIIDTNEILDMVEEIENKKKSKSKDYER